VDDGQTLSNPKVRFAKVLTNLRECRRAGTGGSTLWAGQTVAAQYILTILSILSIPN